MLNPGKIFIGTNFFEDCENPLLISGTPLFSYGSAGDGTLTITLKVPSPPANEEVVVLDNLVIRGGVSVRADKRGAAVTLKGTRLIEVITGEEADTVNIDLRPLSLDIHSDEKSLYVGKSELSGNVFKNLKGGISIEE